jgi:hypothetical protein
MTAGCDQLPERRALLDARDFLNQRACFSESEGAQQESAFLKPFS